MTITLYGIAASRAARALWLLEEAGASYEHISHSYLGGGTRTPETGVPWGDPYTGQILPVHIRPGQTLHPLKAPKRPADKQKRFFYGELPANARIARDVTDILRRCMGLLHGWTEIHLEHLQLLFNGRQPGGGFFRLAHAPRLMTPNLALMNVRMLVSELLQQNDTLDVREMMDFRFRITRDDAAPWTLQLSVQDGEVGFARV